MSWLQEVRQRARAISKPDQQARVDREALLNYVDALRASHGAMHRLKLLNAGSCRICSVILDWEERTPEDAASQQNRED